MLKNSVKEQVIVRFIRDLSTLVNASVPLVKSLEVLARQQEDKSFALVVGNIAGSVHSGLPLSISLTRYPKVFDHLFISMVRAGEASCKLGEVLDRIAKQKDRELKLRKKIRSTMIYPLVVISIAMVIVSLLFLFIIPKFESVFSTAFKETALPLGTRVIVALSHSFQEGLVALVIMAMGVSLIFKLVKRDFWDRFLLKLPIIGKLIIEINISVFARILGTLLYNGVSLMEALKVSESVARNSLIRKSLEKARFQIEEGDVLSVILSQGGYFPEMATGMIHVGEETGTLANMLLEIGNKLEDDVESSLGNLTAVLEPLMTLLLAVVIGAIVIALFLPIVSIMNSIAAF